MSAFGRRLGSLTIVIIIVALTGVPARAQDLDRGKSGAQLFETDCVACHHGPGGLARGNFGWGLSSFLEQHYTTGSASAQVLSAAKSLSAQSDSLKAEVHKFLVTVHAA